MPKSGGIDLARMPNAFSASSPQGWSLSACGIRVRLDVVRHIDLEAGDSEGCDYVAGFEILDGRDAAVGEADEGARRGPAATRPASAAGATATRGSASAR